MVENGKCMLNCTSDSFRRDGGRFSGDLMAVLNRREFSCPPGPSSAGLGSIPGALVGHYVMRLDAPYIMT